MIEIRNLYKKYHNHHGSDWVLRNINLTIPKGISVGLIGANGAGKSTLLRLISGMDMPERGEVIRHSRVSWPVGLSGGMQGNMTGRQNVKFVARMQGGNPKEVERVIQFVEKFAEIGEAFDEPIRTYSSGMRSRVSFGLSLAFDFDVYISDEATAVGDRAFKEKAKELFKSKVGQASLIMVSHGEGILRELCQAGIYLKNGSAHWYENIEDAIIAYHADSDKQKGNSSATAKAEKIDTSFTPKEKLQSLRQKLQESRPKANGLRMCINTAREEGWPKEEMNVLMRLHKQAREEVNELLDAINNTPEGNKASTKQDINKATISLDALSAVLKVEKDNLSSYELSILERAEKAAQRNKTHAEKILEKLEGDD